MDRDIFARGTGLGRQTAEVIADALEGRHWSPFLPERLVESLVQAAGGVSVAKPVLDLIDTLHGATPYIPGFPEPRDPCAQLDQILRNNGEGRLDSVLVDVAKRLISERPTASQVAEEFVFEVIARWSLECRGGLIEKYGPLGYNSRQQEIRTVLRPLVERLARTLVNRPEARALGVTRLERVSADDDLRGTPVSVR